MSTFKEGVVPFSAYDIIPNQSRNDFFPSFLFYVYVPHYLLFAGSKWCMHMLLLCWLTPLDVAIAYYWIHLRVCSLMWLSNFIVSTSTSNLPTNISFPCEFACMIMHNVAAQNTVSCSTTTIYTIWITTGLKLDKHTGEMWSNLSPSQSMEAFTRWYICGNIFMRSTPSDLL